MMLLTLCCGIALLGQAAPETSERRISGPYTHENLSVYLIHADTKDRPDLDCLTLEEAFAAGTIHITEKSGDAEVNELEVENTGDKPVYLQAGDTVKGGKQDRTIAVDALIPPKSGKHPVGAFCVEPGRWQARQQGGSDAAFSMAPAPLATNEQKLAVRLDKSQQGVWEAGREANAGLNAQSGEGGSYVLAAEDKDVQKALAAYVDALRKAPEGQADVVGMATAVNGELVSAEIYGAPNLFRKLWPKLLKGSALEALSKKAAGNAATKPPDVAGFLAAEAGSEEKIETLPYGMHVTTREGEAAATFETRKDGSVIHTQTIKK